MEKNKKLTSHAEVLQAIINRINDDIAAYGLTAIDIYMTLPAILPKQLLDLIGKNGINPDAVPETYRCLGIKLSLLGRALEPHLKDYKNIPDETWLKAVSHSIDAMLLTAREEYEKISESEEDAQ